MNNTPRSDRFDDVYFSAQDGPGETLHVFCNGNNLPTAWQGRPAFTIGETGFGTGLNFLLAWQLFDQTAPKGAFLDFVSVEKYPLSAAQIKSALSPWADRLSPYLDQLLAHYPLRVPGFHRLVFDRRVALTLIFDDVADALPEIDGTIDAWFLDGFTPAKNPDMWSTDVFAQVARLSHAGTTFATFTAAGFVKRGLQNVGFHVEKAKGFGHKRDMLKGVFIKDTAHPAQRPIPDRVSILGAGLAGTSAAYALAQYNIPATLYDPNGIAGGASGNPLGMINPRISAHRTPESDFYTAAFAMTARCFTAIQGVDYRQCGSLHLITDDDKSKRFTQTLSNWGWSDETMRLVDADAASTIAGIPVTKPALYLPLAGYINPSALCRSYAMGVECKPIYMPDGAPVIYAHGMGILEHMDLPIHTVRGQISRVKSTDISQQLKTNIAYGGYISAYQGNGHICGSTFQKWLSHTTVLEEDHRAILARLHEAVPSLIGLHEITGGRASLRVSSRDRFPIAGAVEGQEGAYLTTAHGSHGIVSTLAIAHVLADMLRGGIKCLSRSSLSALNLSRFNKMQAKKASASS